MLLWCDGSQNGATFVVSCRNSGRDEFPAEAGSHSICNPQTLREPLIEEAGSRRAANGVCPIRVSLPIQPARRCCGFRRGTLSRRDGGRA